MLLPSPATIEYYTSSLPPFCDPPLRSPSPDLLFASPSPPSSPISLFSTISSSSSFRSTSTSTPCWLDPLTPLLLSLVLSIPIFCFIGAGILTRSVIDPEVIRVAYWMLVGLGTMAYGGSVWWLWRECLMLERRDRR
ncbi:hypothetical protein EX30DRAFT_338518 [Ascodesmis nigricans]|uniref:Uncharacterized protein n=1 Tax=Ascodesmis nigricans TaxID=341454 RepID=A0A4S2N3Z6_9PEZI|nr:hypothetical protein EX30DRAFT_338518 [Ascodesmis nigricans]